MENNNQNNEQLLLDMATELERKNKTIWVSMWVILATTLATLLTAAMIVKHFVPEGIWQTVTIIGIAIVCDTMLLCIEARNQRRCLQV
jgi:undecaprenyl pyrophosphate phosphatase UppP